MGDEVLKGFASLVKELKGAEEIACRYGGEEFVILMPRTTKKRHLFLLKNFVPPWRKRHLQQMELASMLHFRVELRKPLLPIYILKDARRGRSSTLYGQAIREKSNDHL